MDIKLRKGDSVRLYSGTDDTFTDVKATNNQHVLEMGVYGMHRLQIRAKEGSYNMFVIPRDMTVEDVDYGWWDDAVVVWDNGNKINDEKI